MQFGLFSHIPWPEGTEPKKIIAETIEQIQYGEELGFESAWLAEHHFSRYGLGASSLLLLSAIAARTSTIRLGTAILVPPLHHPVRLAEDTATLDLVSNGRLDVGFGRGSATYEYHGYDVDHAESQARFQETIRLVEALWTTADCSYQGQYFSVHRANLVPPPVQKPHPPIYIAATRTPETLKFVVSTGHPLIIGVVLDTVDALALCQRFVRMSEAAGFGVPISRIPFSRYFYVAETEEQARQDTRESLAWTLDMIQWRRTFSEGSEVYQRLADWRRQRPEPPPSYDDLFERRAIIGTPEACVAKMKALQEQGIEHFVCNFAFGGMPHDKVMRSMQLCAREVMPHFRSGGRRAG
jgi:alkanesulfonate monooxygenase SsuD/methylene tetrahydromethanopterin reductase-like flavin-dependent oxidoreductase (luciferase family)